MRDHLYLLLPAPFFFDNLFIISYLAASLHKGIRGVRMRGIKKLFGLVAFIILFPAVIVAQGSGGDNLLNGFFIRAGYTTFDQVMLLSWDEKEFLMDKGKSLVSIGAGYSYIPSDFWAGVSISANYTTTSLEDFKMGKYLDRDILSGGLTNPILYSGISYSLLMFDIDIHLIPIEKFPAVLTIGVMLGGSFQKYSVIGDFESVMNANGDKSLSMFRYGYIVGAKVVPFKFLSIDLQYRPMGAYSEKMHYSDFLYSRDGWNYYGSATTSQSPSESMFFFGISFHF